MAFVTHHDRHHGNSLQTGVGGSEIIGLPFLGELWGDVGGEESWEEALDTVSSGCRRCLSFPSSDRDRIFFRDWGELVPVDICKTMSRISMRNGAIPPGSRDDQLHCLGFSVFFSQFAFCQTASRWQSGHRKTSLLSENDRMRNRKHCTSVEGDNN